MNLEKLRTVQVEERASTDLQSLPESFYQDVASYIDGLRAERDRAAKASDDPFGSDTVRQLTDEIETAEEVVESIYDRRVGKVVTRASLKASGLSVDDVGLTAEEGELFTRIVELMESHRSDVFATLSGTSPETIYEESEPIPRTAPPAEDSTIVPRGDEPSPSVNTGEHSPTDTTTDQETDSPTEPAEPRGDQGENTDHSCGEHEDSEERITVRITQDIGEIFGVDERTYVLSSEDVVTLPVANAKPLIERNAAQRLE